MMHIESELNACLYLTHTHTFIYAKQAEYAAVLKYLLVFTTNHTMHSHRIFLSKIRAISLINT